MCKVADQAQLSEHIKIVHILINTSLSAGSDFNYPMKLVNYDPLQQILKAHLWSLKYWCEIHLQIKNTL